MLDAYHGCANAAPFVHSDAAPPHDPLPFSRRRSPVPLVCEAPAGETFAGVPVGAFEAMMQRRTRMIAEFGHTPAEDLKLRPSVLPDRAIKAIVAAQEDAHFQRAEQWRELAKRHLAEAGAFIAAAWDYFDNGGGER